MCGWLFVLFTVVPALEIYLLIQAGKVFGGANTVLAVIAAGVVGSYYARREGLAVLARVQNALAEGRPPADEMLDGAMILAGGILLVTPGFLTDVVGITLLLPPTRLLWKRVASRWIRRKIERGEIVVHHRPF